MIVKLYTIKNILKTKTKPYESKTKTNFHNYKISKEGSHCVCLSIILIESVLKQVKTIILKYFQKNVNILLKKRIFLMILLTT